MRHYEVKLSPYERFLTTLKGFYFHFFILIYILTLGGTGGGFMGSVSLKVITSEYYFVSGNHLKRYPVNRNFYTDIKINI